MWHKRHRRSLSAWHEHPLRRLSDAVPPMADRAWFGYQSAGMSVASEEEVEIYEEVNSGYRGPLMRRVEAILFLAREPMNSRKLASFVGLKDGTQARTLVKSLNKLYDDDQMAFRIEQVAGGYQLLTRPQFDGWLQKLKIAGREWRLSEPAMETLAVVAYRQPVLRVEIESVRGVACGEILRQLMERDLVRIGGRSEELGRPYLYTTTRRFLQIFGLSSLDHLPYAEEIRNPQSL